LPEFYHFAFCIKRTKSKAISAHQIVGKIKLRLKNCRPVIYWSGQKSNGKLKQWQVYWGALPTGKLKLFVNWINKPDRSARRRICRIVRIKIDDLPANYLRNSDFLKKHIFGELKRIENDRKKNDKRYLSGHLRRTLQRRRIINYRSLFSYRATKLRVLFDKMEKECQPSKNWGEQEMYFFEFDSLRELKNIIARAEKWK
jgi:hypothetical protein